MIVMICQMDDGQTMCIEECKVFGHHVYMFDLEHIHGKILLVQSVIRCFVTLYKKILMFYGPICWRIFELNIIPQILFDILTHLTLWYTNVIVSSSSRWFRKKKICPDKSLMNAGMKDNAIRKW